MHLLGSLSRSLDRFSTTVLRAPWRLGFLGLFARSSAKLACRLIYDDDTVSGGTLIVDFVVINLL